MKRYLTSIAVFVLAGLGASGQASNQGYTVTGNLKNCKDSILHMAFSGDPDKKDSAYVHDGRFVFKGKVQEPVMAIIYGQHTRASFYIENRPISITGDAATAAAAYDDIALIVEGSATEKEYEVYRTSVKDLHDQQMTLYKQYEDADEKKDTAAIAAIRANLATLEVERKKRIIAYVHTHPSSPVSLHEMRAFMYGEGVTTADSLFATLDKAQQNSKAGKDFARDLAIHKSIAIGRPALDFTQKDLQGRTVQLSQYRGKYVLLDFWASWCGPCRAENPNVLKAYNQYKDKHFDVLGVSLDNDKAKWQEAVEKDGMPWTQVSDLQGWKNVAARQYDVNGIPSNFLIDPNGIIIATNLRGDDLEKKLGEVLK